jgi:hypothetical protein
MRFQMEYSEEKELDFSRNSSILTFCSKVNFLEFLRISPLLWHFEMASVLFCI